ncbi:hypothetical protein AV530_015388 [Patagioenas fasciata monilis]|uniref:Uncharacterized protein n=1 Tax=Patagioenas fasciata monilis TaxID=372326 RepID=A0A1V4JV59_PATFA|nr:hypothetical protein AV530_015388 [Patagioenas fasciata monilis]
MEDEGANSLEDIGPESTTAGYSVLQLHFMLNMTQIVQHFAELKHYQIPWNGKCFLPKNQAIGIELQSEYGRKKCQLL